MTITAIVCAYNEAHYLPACLYSLLAQTRPPDEIIVVNNASTDGPAPWRARVPGVRVIDEPTQGPGRGARDGAPGGQRRHPGVSSTPTAARRSHGSSASNGGSRRRGRCVAVTGPYRFYDWDWPGVR